VLVLEAHSQQSTPLKPSAAEPLKASVAPASVADWSLRHRFEEVLRLAPSHMGPELAAQFRAMLTPVNVGIIAVTLTAWAVSHAFGAGEVVDIGLLAVGAVFLGMAVFKAGEDIGECLMTTLNAETQPDLDRAAGYLAQAVAILGVVAFFSLLARVGARFGRAASAGGEDAAATSADTAQNQRPGHQKHPSPMKHLKRVVRRVLGPKRRLKTTLHCRIISNGMGKILGRRPLANISSRRAVF
jgi:hypothetical protein